MEAKHTPGPWTEIDGFITSHGGDICDPHLRAGPPDHAERDANAALIAAAPDLLEACKAALRVLVDNRHTHDTAGLDRDCIDAYDTGLSSPISAVLSSAIAKAGGEA